MLKILFDLRAEWLVLGALFDGFGGFLPTVMMASSSYIADCTSPESRITRLAIVELCSLISVVVAPIGLGYWIHIMSYLYPIITVAVVCTVNILYVTFFVPVACFLASLAASHCGLNCE